MKKKKKTGVSEGLEDMTRGVGSSHNKKKGTQRDEKGILSTEKGTYMRP